VLQRRPNTFAQTNLSTSFFACDKAADHTFRIADNPPSGEPTPRCECDGDFSPVGFW
jgi:hypothetical protein